MKNPSPLGEGQGVGLVEQPIYGSARIGTYIGKTQKFHRTLGNKLYEISNHLGNVLATITDNKIYQSGGFSTAKVISAQDNLHCGYFAFGASMPSRSYQDSGYGKYRYGYQGSESNEEIDGTYTTEYRQLSTKTCRWWSIDPKATAYESPYVSMGNNPIWFNDVKGDSIRLLDFTKKQAMFFRKLLSDLKSKTGISFKLYKNNKGDKFLWFSEIDETKGSETARKFLLDAISSKETTMLLIDLTDGLGRGDGSSSTTADGKVIVLNATSIENRIKNTVGLNKTTFGYALTFLHELRHSAPGGKYKDYEHNRFFMPDGLKQNQTLFHLGGTEPIVNKIRKELGSNYGQRMVYGSFVIEDKLYNAFDRKGLEKLRQGEIPERYVAQDILLSPITTNADE